MAQNTAQRSALQMLTGMWMSGAADSAVEVVRAASGMPGKGKVFAAIHANAIDIPLHAAGLCAKLIKEGWTGYLIRASNDEKTGTGNIFKNWLANEEDHVQASHAVGFTNLFDLYYRDQCMAEESPLEIRARLIFIFRILKVNAVITCLPSGIDRENPDALITPSVVSQACWMAGLPNHYPEHADSGAAPHTVTERWYAVSPAMPHNRVVDIAPVIDVKIDAIRACRQQGGAKGSQLRKQLAAEGQRLPILGSDDATADRAYIRKFTLASSKALGERYGLSFVESFIYFNDAECDEKRRVAEYVRAHAVKL